MVVLALTKGKSDVETYFNLESSIARVLINLRIYYKKYISQFFYIFHNVCLGGP